MSNAELIAEAREVYASGDFLVEDEVLRIVDALEKADGRVAELEREREIIARMYGVID